MDLKTVFITKPLHREAKKLADQEGKKLKFFVSELVQEAIDNRKAIKEESEQKAVIDGR